jgi:hypothetical protein
MDRAAMDLELRTVIFEAFAYAPFHHARLPVSGLCLLAIKTLVVSR